MMSMPSVVTLSAVTPVCGRAKATIKAVSATTRSPNSACRYRPVCRVSARLIGASDEYRSDPTCHRPRTTYQ